MQTFVAYLESIEAELEPYSDGHRKQHLLSKLRPEIRRAITNYQDIPITRAGLISLAARLEQNLRRASETRPSTSRQQAEPTDGKDQLTTQPSARGESQRGRSRGRRRGPPRRSPIEIVAPTRTVFLVRVDEEKVV